MCTWRLSMSIVARALGRVIQSLGRAEAEQAEDGRGRRPGEGAESGGEVGHAVLVEEANDGVAHGGQPLRAAPPPHLAPTSPPPPTPPPSHSVPHCPLPPPP